MAAPARTSWSASGFTLAFDAELNANQLFYSRISCCNLNVFMCNVAVIFHIVHSVVQSFAAHFGADGSYVFDTSFFTVSIFLDNVIKVLPRFYFYKK